MHSEQKKLLHVTLQKVESTSKGEKVYERLVYKVFFDALSSAYPLFYEKVDKKEFEKVICEFMSFGAKSVEMWKMPDEFRKFVKKQKKFRSIAFTDELLWFEWIEMKLMMKNYKTQLVQEFSYKENYKLSKCSVLKKLRHRVFERKSFDSKGEFFLLGYYDLNEKRVYFIEISQVMYLFLKELKKNGSKKAVTKIALMSEQRKNEVKEFFSEPLADYQK